MSEPLRFSPHGELENEAPRHELSFVLTGHPPNDNATRRWHWGKVARERKVWHDAAMWAARDAYGRSSLRGVFGPVTIHVEFHYTVRRTRDRDNMVASLKPILDGLKTARIIKDDGPEWVRDLTVSEVVNKQGRDGIYVKVTEV